MELARNNHSVDPSDTDSLSEVALPTVLHDDQYWPAAPMSLEDAGLSLPLVETIVCQCLLAEGTLSGRRLSEKVGLPFGIVENFLGGLRTRLVVAHARSAPLNDYYYSLTDAGQKRTLNSQKSFVYTGPAPVPMSEYLLSVEAQSNQYEAIERAQLTEAMAEI
ncbi:MAG: hypothetical protein VXZ82_18185 [Planctomycetota bacterium]|nr:hypothetical protein [Planctomycetota bacterium]